MEFLILKKILLLTLFFQGILCVIMNNNAEDDNLGPQPPPPPAPDILEEEPDNFNDALKSCLSKKTYGTWECFNRGALSTLQSLNNDDCLNFGEIKLEKSQTESRNLLDLDWDAKDFGNVVKAASNLMERRSLKWDLGRLYPGLQLKVGPMLNGDGILEFDMDERNHHFSNRHFGTGNIFYYSN